jgi:hypothetical protein
MSIPTETLLQLSGERCAGRKHRLGKCEREQARAKQDKTRNGHTEEAVRNEFFTHGVHHLSLGNAGYRLGYCVRLPEQNDCHFAQSKGFRAVPKNRTLTDALEQQEAGPVVREQTTNRGVA